MPRKCCIPNCNVSNYDPLYSSVTFHTVPKNAVEREKWTQSIENNFPLNIKKYFYICSLHFDEDCFYYAHNCKYRRIKKGSYPTKFYDVQEEFIQSIKCISLSDVENVQEFDECVDDETENDLEDDSKTCEPQESVAVAEICNHETKAIVEQINYDSEQILKLKKDPTEDFVASAHENSLHTKTVKCINSKCSETIIKKSIINIDVDSIDITEQNTAQIKNILHQAKNEVAILRRKNKALAMTIFRSRKKVKNSKSLLNHIKQRKFISEELYEVLEKTIPINAREIFKKFLFKPKVNTKCPDALRSFATTLHFYSPKAYNFVRNRFLKVLPHPVTIRKWFQTVRCSSGVNNLSIEIIKQKIKLETEINHKIVLCNMAIDEMKIKKRIEIIQGTEYGFVDVRRDSDTEADTFQEAENVLVVMLVCINNKWKIPLAFYFVNALTGKEKANLIKQNLLALQEIDSLKITSITFDGLQSNISMCKELGAEISNDYSKELFFLHPASRDPIYVMFDACHMLKLIRNSIATEDMFNAEGSIVSWIYFEHLVKYQELNGLHAGTKIRRQHINWRENKMNVKLAAQSLSESVSTTLKYLEFDENLPEFQGAEATAQFCSIINAGFDILNSRNKFEKIN